MSELSFISPWWFLALIPLVILLVLFVRRQFAAGRWHLHVDQHLLQAQVTGEDGKTSWLGPVLLGMAWLLGVIALAGPSFETVRVPATKPDHVQIVALDLSLSMLATDLKPDRQTRARIKLLDLLTLSKGSRTGLLAFAGRSHLVTPITDNLQTMKHLVPALEAKLLPNQGSNLAAPILHAIQLLQQANKSSGNIILIVDGKPDKDAFTAAKAASDAGYQLHIIGAGTPVGAPVLDSKGRPVKTGGKVVVVRLDETALKELAAAGNGSYQRMTINNDDIAPLIPNFDGADSVEDTEEMVEGDIQHDVGYWLVLLLLPIAALAFRRGWLLSIAATSLLIGAISPSPVFADEANTDPDPEQYKSLWKNDDQTAETAYHNKDYAVTEQQHSSPLWKGTAAYRAGNYEKALEFFSESEAAIADYNRGNTLAQLDKLEEALDAYNLAAKKDEKFDDIVQNNREVIAREITRRKLEKQQNSQQPNPSDPKNKNGNNKNDQNQQSNQAGKKGQEKQEQGGSASNKKPQQQQKNPNQSQAQQQQSPSQSGSPQQSNKTKDPQKNQAGKKADKDGKQQAKQANQGQPKGPKQDGKGNKLSKQALGKVEKERQFEQMIRSLDNSPADLLRRKFKRQALTEGRTAYSGDPW